MLALALVLYCAGSALALKECSNAGCFRHEDTGYTFVYIRHGADYVNITAYVETDGGTWVGVGISNDTMMADTDSVVGGRSADLRDYFLEDGYIQTRGVRPRYDDIQDLTNRRVEIVNNYTVISFTRPISSTRDTMWDYDLDEARYVLWAFGGSITNYGSDTTGATYGRHTPNQRGVFPDKIYLCEDNDDTNNAEAIRMILERCPIPTASSTDAAGHVTVSLISILTIALMSVFAVSL